MFLDEEKPIPAPCDITTYAAVAGDVNRNLCSFAITGDIADRYFAVLVEDRADDPNWRFHAMISNSDPPDMRERNYQSDGAVTAHA